MKTRATFLVLLVFTWMMWPGSGRKWAEIFVSEGQNGHAVARQLTEAGVVRTPLPFLLWVKFRRAEKRLQVGKYRFAVGRSAFWIVDDLIQGRTEKVRFVIPEGFASWQIADRLDSLKICDGDAFREIVRKENLEGYLFPATYELTNGLSPSTVARRFTAEFDARWTPEIDARAKALGLTKLETVTLASIVEREVRVREELPLVSAVYHNRLKKKMKLAADPTVQFALGFWKSRLRNRDYREAQSPYNTYLHPGLPPGPICNPGWDAVLAALSPASSNALFFVAKEDGRHDFSDTYREHVNKVNKRNRTQR